MSIIYSSKVRKRVPTQYLARCFEIMKRQNLHLNPKKCTFAVTGGKFLGFMVTHKGIEVNLEKAQNILKMQPPTPTKDI